MGGRAGHLEAEVAVPSSARAASWASQAGRASLLCAVFLSLWVSPLFFFPSLTRGFGRRNNDACRAGSSQVSEVDLFGGGRSVGQTRQPTTRSASVLPGLDFMLPMLPEVTVASVIGATHSGHLPADPSSAAFLTGARSLCPFSRI